VRSISGYRLRAGARERRMFSVVGLPVPFSVTVRVFFACTVDTEPLVVPWMFFVLSFTFAASTFTEDVESAVGKTTFETLTKVAGPPFCVQVMVVSNRKEPLRPAIPLTTVVALFTPQLGYESNRVGVLLGAGAAVVGAGAAVVVVAMGKFCAGTAATGGTTGVGAAVVGAAVGVGLAEPVRESVMVTPPPPPEGKAANTVGAAVVVVVLVVVGAAVGAGVGVGAGVAAGAAVVVVVLVVDVVDVDVLVVVGASVVVVVEVVDVAVGATVVLVVLVVDVVEVVDVVVVLVVDVVVVVVPFTTDP
jgi:hypothetical protein